MESEERPMLKITFVVPYLDLQETVQRCIDRYRDERISFESFHILGVEEAKRLRFSGDIVIARGITYAAVREYHPEVTAVEIPVTGYDVIRALDECRREFRARKIAIIGSGNMIYGAQTLHGILDVEVVCYRAQLESDTGALVREALQGGAEAIVGGLTAYTTARDLGVPSTWIKSGEDAIRQAIDEAVRASEIQARERERAEFFKIVMDYTHEAILSVDRRGLITAMNRTARSILGTEGDTAVGTPIRRYLPSTGLMEVLRRGEEEIGALEHVGDVMIAANLVPIRVGSEVTGAVATFQNVSRIQEIEGRIRKKIHSKGLTAKYAFDDITGKSEGLRKAIQAAANFSRVDANILIIGETGTGKELFAHSIHAASARTKGPFVAINCAALPENLLDSELFGYAEGAFTGASRGGKAGLFELAHGGTIFLDEIAEVSLTLQAKLLRVLQEREIMRIGDDRVIPVNVRVIAATNRDLRRQTNEGGFRTDLLYRIDVLRIHIPPLRSRREDIPLLLDRFLRIFADRFGSPPVRLSPEAAELLYGYRWPGNVRELMNVCERLAALAGDGVIVPGDLALALDWEPAEEAVAGTE